MDRFFVAPSGFPVGGYVAYQNADATTPLRHPKDEIGTLPPRHRTIEAAAAYGRKVLRAIDRASNPTKEII